MSTKIRTTTWVYDEPPPPVVLPAVISIAGSAVMVLVALALTL